MEDYKGNSNTNKQTEERKKATPISNAKDVKVKKSLASKFFAQDIKSTGKGVFEDVAIPGIKNLLVTMVKKGIDYLILGKYSPNSDGHTNYSSFGAARNVTYSNNGSSWGTQRPPAKASDVYSSKNIYEIYFEDRGTAEEVLERLKEALARYGMVSVLEFYDIIDKKCTPQENKYGWRTLDEAYVASKSEGYQIIFPKITVLED